MPWLKVVEALKAPVGTALTVKGWVRTRRDSKADGGLSFITVHDGTCQDPIQVVVRSSLANYQTDVQRLSTGCAVEVDGMLAASQGKGQAVELAASGVRVVGWVDDPDSYPVSAKRHTFEYLREVAHLRIRTNTFGAVFRVRTPSPAPHRFYQDRGFDYVHTPIITASDGEGAGADVPGHHPRPRDPSSHARRRHRFRAGLLRPADLPHRVRPAQRRGLRPGA